MYNDLVEKFKTMQKDTKDTGGNNDALAEKVDEQEKANKEKDDEIKRLERELQDLKDARYCLIHKFVLN